MIEAEHTDLSITRQCQLLDLNRTSYYAFRQAKPAQESNFNLLLMNLMDKEYTRHPFYGSRKMVAYLRRQGHADRERN